MKKLNFIICITACIIISGLFTNCSTKKTQFNPDAKKLPKLTLLNHNKIMTDLLGEPKIDIQTIGILVYDGCHTMEALGAMSVFSEMLDVRIYYIAAEKGVIKTDAAEIFVDKTIDEFDSLDLLIIPGADENGMKQILSSQSVKSWIRKIDTTSKLTAGIGYGSLVLGKCDLLKGRKVAMDWYNAKENTENIGAKWVDQRYVSDGKYWTSRGQTASLDLGFAMLQAITGDKHVQAAMLDLEYDPAPPLRAGTNALTPADILAIAGENTYTVDGLYLVNDTKYSRNLNSSIFNAKKSGTKNIGILVYDGFFTLDAIGPLVVLSQMPGVNVKLIAKQKGKVKTGRTYLNVNHTLGETEKLDLLLIPGGAVGTFNASQDSTLLSWIRKIDMHTQYTVSVCTGSWILGSAGLLKGRTATSNWYMAKERMEFYGAKYKKARYTNDGKYWTSAGVSAGIDLSYAVMEDIYGPDFLYYSMLQLAYHPQPPIAGGSPENTHPLVTDMMVQMYDYGMKPLLKKEKKNQKSKVETIGHPIH